MVQHSTRSTRRVRPFAPRCWYVLALLVVWGPSHAADDDRLFADAYAGAVDEDLFIGVMVADHPPVSQRRAVVIYLCDGADESTWLFGEAIGESAVLENDGVRVSLSWGAEGVVGVVDTPGAPPRPFVADVAGPEAGLFRTVATFEGREYVAGWVVLNDGRQRGALTLDARVVENPTLDTSTGQAQTSFGTMGTNCFRNPFTGERICRYLN